MTQQTTVQALSNLANMISSGAHKYGQDAINLSASYLHYSAIIDIIIALSALTVTFILGFITYKNGMSVKSMDSFNEPENVATIKWMKFILSLLFTFCAFIMFLSFIVDSTTWIALFSGKLALVSLVFPGYAL